MNNNRLQEAKCSRSIIDFLSTFCMIYKVEPKKKKEILDEDILGRVYIY